MLPSNFDTIRCMNIKILQVIWCSWLYLEFSESFFIFFYLFDCKFVDLMVFFFFTRQNMHTQKIGCISEVLCTRAHLITMEHAICPGLLHHLLSLEFFFFLKAWLPFNIFFPFPERPTVSKKAFHYLK